MAGWFFAEDPDEGEMLFCIPPRHTGKNVFLHRQKARGTLLHGTFVSRFNAVPFEVVYWIQQLVGEY